MACGKRDVNKRRNEVKAQIEALENKIKMPGATKEDHEMLTKLRNKLK